MIHEKERISSLRKHVIYFMPLLHVSFYWPNSHALLYSEGTLARQVKTDLAGSSSTWNTNFIATENYSTSLQNHTWNTNPYWVSIRLILWHWNGWRDRDDQTWLEQISKIEVYICARHCMCMSKYIHTLFKLTQTHCMTTWQSYPALHHRELGLYFHLFWCPTMQIYFSNNIWTFLFISFFIDLKETNV